MKSAVIRLSRQRPHVFTVACPHTVIDPSRVLDGDRHAVIPSAALVEVVVLEVEPRLGEAVDVRDVVDRVHNVERVRARGVQVRLHRRRLVLVLREDELARRGLARHARLGALERDRVVPAAEYAVSV